MVAAAYGKRQSIARLREIAGTDRSGTNLSGLCLAAEAIGFQARAVRGAFESISKIALPAIAHWNEGDRHHFVVIYKVTSKRVVLGDPGAGLRKLHPEEFRRFWTGVLVLISPTPRLREVISAKSSFAQLFSLTLPHRRLFLDAMLAAVLITILGLTSSFFIQALVDYVFVLGQKPALNWLGLGMLLVHLARVGFLALRSHLLAHLSQRIDADTVLGYHRHLLGLPLPFFVSRRMGEILSRINDAVKIRIAASVTTLSLFVDCFLLIAAMAVMLWMDWTLTLLALAPAPLLALSASLLNAPLKRHQRLAMEKAAELEAQIVENIGAIHAVKAFRASLLAQLRTEACFVELMDASFRSQALAIHISVVSALTTAISTLALLWLGASRVLEGAMTVGQLMALHTLLGTVLGPIERLSTANHSIQEAVIAAERLGEVLDLDTETHNERKSAVDRAIEGKVEFRDVSFRYGARAPVFDRLSLRIDPGECVGIGGESGMGKTTFANLIGRFFDPASGSILVDGMDIRDYTLDCLRRQVAFVPQDVVLVNGSIADNIRFGRLEATATQMREAARMARVDEFVERMPRGYDTPVGERGVALSGGERQRIAVARAIVMDPAILVLDEPTSQLDRVCESAIQEIIDQRRGVRTTIVISHRPLRVDRMIQLNECKFPVALPARLDGFAPCAVGVQHAD